MYNTKTLIAALLIAISATSISTTYAEAGHMGNGGHWNGGHWSGGCFGCGLWLFDALLATDIAIQSAQQPVVAAPPPVYVQPAYVQPMPAQPEIPTWYFCKSTNGYYPYTQYCPEGWQPISAIPPH
jgi:hypothetical protein